MDEFYGISELYFYAPERRRYRAEVWFDEGTEVDVLVHNITLDDVLTGTVRRPTKKKGMSMYLPGAEESIRKSIWQYDRALREGKLKERLKPIPKEERWRRDAIIWFGLPHPNQQLATTNDTGHRRPFTYGVGGRTMEEIEEEYGKWEYLYPAKPGDLSCH